MPKEYLHCFDLLPSIFTDTLAATCTSAFWISLGRPLCQVSLSIEFDFWALVVTNVFSGRRENTEETKWSSYIHAQVLPLISVIVLYKLQALVYDILPSTTAVFSYATGPRKL